MMGFPLPGVCLFREWYKELLQSFIQGLLQENTTLDQCNMRGPLSKLDRTPPQRKINVTSKSPVGDNQLSRREWQITAAHGHRQKAENVWKSQAGLGDSIVQLNHPCVWQVLYLIISSSLQVHLEVTFVRSYVAQSGHGSEEVSKAW